MRNRPGRIIEALGALAVLWGSAGGQEPTPRLGERDDEGATLVPTRQRIRAAGEVVEFGGRPVDLVVSPDGTLVFAKDNRGVVVLDAEDLSLLQQAPFPEGGTSMHGIGVSKDGSTVWATSAADHLHEGTIGEDGTLSWTRAIRLPGTEGEGASYPCGFALNEDETVAYVALSRNNSVAEVNMATGEVVREIPVGIAPFDVELGPDGTSVYVSNWGGRRPLEGELTAPSSGTPVLVDERGVGKSGTVGKIDLMQGAMVAEIATGLHPSDLVLDAGEGLLFVANANSDTVGIVDVSEGSFAEKAEILVRPDDSLSFGSASNALALSDDGGTLYVANGGNNAVAVVALDDDRAGGQVVGFIPAGWYPGALAIGPGGTLYVANVKGLGSRREPEDPAKGRSVYAYLGTVQAVEPPDEETLAGMTAQVLADARVPQALRAWEREQARADVPPKAVPERLGEPSVFEHVVYVIKENRTYDQVFGDLPQGEGDPDLCIFGREITPNHHALAEQFVLLDNFYCNGVLSADGHSWVTEGNVTDHLEKAFGGFTRSYTFGDDPLTYSSTGFIWDNVLLHGLSFRNYGEMDYAKPVPDDATFSQIYEDFINGTNEITFTREIGIDMLRRYSSPTFPGWNMNIPDVLRVDRFLKELAEFEESGDFPELSIVFLPQDHGSGTTPGMPTPNAHMADNDLAVGRLVEGISKSRFWPKTCIFVIEDDPQNGFDHIDGHRSICLVASPYTKRGEVVSEFYNQTAVLHTMERMLGLPPMNQMDAMSPLMTECFVDEADLAPFEAIPVAIPLDELNKPVSELPPGQRKWAEASLNEDFSVFDRADEDTLNRILWHFARGPDAPYPAELAGAHGTGLKGRKLIHVEVEDDDDDD